MGQSRKLKNDAIKLSLNQHDWDFSYFCSPCSTKEEKKEQEKELELCWGYEYAREASWLIKQVEAEERPIPSDPNEQDWWHPIYLDRAERDVASFHVWLPPGFPKKAFLSLPEEFRKEQPLVPPLSDNFMEDLPWLDDRPVFVAITEATLKSEFCYPVYINWSKPDKAIIEKFKDLLRNLRKQACPPTETRGKSAPDKLRKELKALGAYRILKVLKASEAIVYTESRRRPFFEDEVNWSKAKSEAKRIIRDYFPEHE